MIEKEVQELLSFIDGNPTAYHTTASVRNILLKEGFSELLESRRWQLEYFANRSDKVGGSTLGNLAMAQVSMNCVDIGLPQLAMHSCYETAGARDTVSLIRLMEEFYASHFEETASGTLTISK